MNLNCVDVRTGLAKSPKWVESNCPTPLFFMVKFDQLLEVHCIFVAAIHRTGGHDRPKIDHLASKTYAHEARELCRPRDQTVDSSPHIRSPRCDPGAANTTAPLTLQSIALEAKWRASSRAFVQAPTSADSDPKVSRTALPQYKHLRKSSDDFRNVI